MKVKHIYAFYNDYLLWTESKENYLTTFPQKPSDNQKVSLKYFWIQEGKPVKKTLQLP